MSNEKMREEFEAWYEGHCAPLESDWFKRDSDFQDDYDYFPTQEAWAGWQASRATPDGYCFVPNETIKKAYALASSVCGDCYAGDDTESLLANQLTKEISKSDYWMSIK